MDINENEFSTMKYVGLLGATILDLILAGACVKSNMRTVPKLGLTILCVEHAQKTLAGALKEIKIHGTNLKVVK